MKWKYTYFVFLFLFLSFIFIFPLSSPSTIANLRTTTITTMRPMNLLDALLLSKGFQLYGVNDYHKLVVFDTRTLILEDEYDLGYNIEECKLLYQESRIIIVSKIPIWYGNTCMIIQSFDISNHKITYIGNITDFLPKNYKDVILFDNKLVYITNNNQLVYYSLTKNELNISSILFENYQNIMAYSPINHIMLTFHYPPANLSFISLETNVLISNITLNLRVIPRILCSYLNSSNQFALILEPMCGYNKNGILIINSQGLITLNITYDPWSSNLTGAVNSEIFEYIHNYYFVTTTGVIYRVNNINNSFETIGDTGLEHFTITKTLVNEPLKQVFLVTIGALYVYYFEDNTLSSVLYPFVQNTYFANEISMPEVLIITSTIIVFSILFVILFRKIKMK